MILREVRPEDIDRFFEHQQDSQANIMAAFAPKNPHDRGVFDYHWSQLLSSSDTVVRTIEEDGEAAGALICSDINGTPELSFWTERRFWAHGITTSAVEDFLSTISQRPIQAHVPIDNIGSQKVLQRQGFRQIDEVKTFSNARAEVVTEYVMQLD